MTLSSSDPVKFGDVALQPPELTARPRASKSVNQVRGVCIFVVHLHLLVCRMRTHMFGCISLSVWVSRACGRMSVQRALSLTDSWPWVVLSPQPGKKSLLLKMCMSPSSGVVMQPPSTSLARQRILGAERERVVLAYRALKQRQRQQADQLPR